MYMGGYSSVASKAPTTGNANAAVGETVVRNVSVIMDSAQFTSCIAMSLHFPGNSFGTNAYGGSLSFFIGAYAWSFSSFFNSSSACAATSASGLSVSVSDAPCSNCGVSVSSGNSFAANAYGGSLSAMHIGAYAWSWSAAASSSSACAATSASGLTVGVRNASCSTCNAISSALKSYAANAYGGLLSAMHIGAYAWSWSEGTKSKSTCEATTANKLDVSVIDTQCSACIASVNGQYFQDLSPISLSSWGANACGGLLSAMHIGAYAWSWSGNSNSTCVATNAQGIVVDIRNVRCLGLCSALVVTTRMMYGGTARGGSNSLLHVGDVAWSWGQRANVVSSAISSSTSISSCGATNANDIDVNASNLPCPSCFVFLQTSSSSLFGVNAHGGLISALHVGALAWSYGFSDLTDTRSTCEPTIASRLSVQIINTPGSQCYSGVNNSGKSYGVLASGGMISAAYVGAHAWSFSSFSSSRSECQTTHVSGLIVNVSNVSCIRCLGFVLTGSSFGANAYGGVLSAMYIGAYAWSVGFNTGISERDRAGYAAVESTIVQNSQIFVLSSVFQDCIIISSSYVSGSQDASVVLGGAVAVIQSPQVFPDRRMASASATNNTGFNLTVLILNSNFLNCSAITYSSSVPRQLASSGGGGAVFAKSPALSSFAATDSNFKNCEVQVLSGTSAADPSQRLSPALASILYIKSSNVGNTPNSIGGALAVDARGSNVSVVEIASSIFFNCKAYGANVSNLVVRGGAVDVSHAASVVVRNTSFDKCQVLDSLKSGAVGEIVSGGAGLSVALAKTVRVQQSRFDATNGQDSSQTSTGLLILTADALRTHVHVQDTSFESKAAVLRFECATNDGIRSVKCASSDVLSLSASNSTVIQSREQNDLSSSNLPLLSFGDGLRLSFREFRMQCLPENVVLKEISQNSANIEYSCGKCRAFEISLTGSDTFLEDLPSSFEMQCVRVSEKGQSRCPLGVSNCDTFVSVSKGFWTDFSESGLMIVERCPFGYCGCESDLSGSCQLAPPLSIGRNKNPLCMGNRIGTLCGRCPADSTQSLNGRTCVKNEVCIKNLWWVWTISIIGWSLYALYIVLSCGEFSDNTISCVLFYFQVSSFASIPDDSGVVELSQFRSFLMLYESSCYAPNLTAYSAYATQLIGPLFVLVFSLSWTWLLRALQPRLQQRNIQMHASYSGTLAAATLFCFSSVAQVVFTLVECTSYDGRGVVLIDGSVRCLDGTWKLLIAVVVLLCLCPVVFAAALWLNKLDDNARAVVCRNFTEPAFYWGALTLAFRLLISLVQFLEAQYPNLLAFVCMLLSVGMLVVLMHTRPHLLTLTFWVDVVCFLSLIAQFGLQTIFTTAEFLAIAPSQEQKNFFETLRILASLFRFAFSSVAAKCLIQAQSSHRVP